MSVSALPAREYSASSAKAVRAALRSNGRLRRDAAQWYGVPIAGPATETEPIAYSRKEICAVSFYRDRGSMPRFSSSPIALLFVVALIAPVLAQSLGPNRRASPAPLPGPFHLRIDAATLAGLPRRTVTATDEAGHTDTYSGVALRDVLTRAGVPTGAPLRGRALTAYVVVGAADGYHVVFSLAELDPSFTDRVVLIAESRDGTPFPPNIGPFRLIVPGEKREARWVRQVTGLDFEIAPSP
jgi:hypothetical protein